MERKNKVSTGLKLKPILVILMGLMFLGHKLAAQAEFTPWGNITGLRIDGQKLPFETSIRVVEKDWRNIHQTRHYRVSPSFKRDGKTVISESELEGIGYKISVTDMTKGEAYMDLHLKAINPGNIEGAFLCIEIPAREYSNGRLELVTGRRSPPGLKFSRTDLPGELLRGTGSGLILRSDSSHITFSFGAAANIIITRGESQTARADHEEFYHVYITLFGSDVHADQETNLLLDIKATATVDKSPATITIDPTLPGQRFDGIGGNFRLQYPRTDPEVIRYCLDSLNVTWGRIAMWWADWHPDEGMDPIEVAKNRGHRPLMYEQMEMARELARRGIPVIVSAWSPPRWAALTGEMRPGTYGHHLHPMKWPEIVQSITDYLLFLKNEFGVEAALFSFNEPDIGVQIVHNYQEHIAFIKMLGKSFAEHGLATKLILADTSNTTLYSLGFVHEGINDQSSHRYIGAIGFHTWGGPENKNLILWAEAARQLNVPIMVTESGPDSEAHRNPDIFTEPWYQMQEIDLYLRLCAMAQPLNIMQWQLTSDYSPLYGGGIYDNEEPLAETQRFWNMKQLGLTPVGSFAIPAVTDRNDITTAAHADIVNGVYTVHMVNNGASREVTIAGLPVNANTAIVYTTTVSEGLKKNLQKVSGGKISLDSGAGTYITLVISKD
jgi:hypothetical protein